MENSLKNPAISSRKKNVEEDGLNFFQTNLKWFREKNSLTQQSLADATGIARANIGAYEEGRANPNPNTLIILADYFGIRVDDLIREVSPTISMETADFEFFAANHIPLNRFIRKSELYETYLMLFPQTTAQAFKINIRNWCRKYGHVFNPKEFRGKDQRIILRHGKKVEEFFYIKQSESEVSNA